jgi:hypothetical protein
MTASERQMKYIARLRARAEGKRNNVTDEKTEPAIRLDWEILVDDECEGYLSAYEEPYGLYVRQHGGALFFWHVNKTEDDDKDVVDVAEGDAPSLVAAMAAAEAAVHAQHEAKCLASDQRQKARQQSP